MTRRLCIDDITKIAVPENPAVSPDGVQIAYVLRTSDTGADRVARSIWRVGARSRSAHRLTKGPADSAPAWSPDGTRLAFLRANDGPPQVWLLPADGGEPEQLTSLRLGAGAPVWSPDGTRIAFAAMADPVAAADETGGTRRVGVPVVADRLDYQADGPGLLGTVRKHLYVVEVASGQCRQLTEGPWNAADPAWSPDGTGIAFAAAMSADADLTLRVGAYILDVRDHAAVPQAVGLLDGVAGPIIWTADEAALVVVGRTGAPVGHAGLLRVRLDGGEIVNLAGPLDRNVMAGGPAYPGLVPRLIEDGRTVVFCARDRGCIHLYAVGVDGGEPRLVLGGPGRRVSGLGVGGATVAVVLATPTSFGEVAVVEPAAGGATVRTEHGAALADVELVDCAEREFTISDGTVVAGWLIRDPTVRGPGPLLLDIHGGPHNAWGAAANETHIYHQELAARGWSVLLLNPRGSDGYGEQFYNAAMGAWGRADAKDFMEPLDTLIAEGVADPDRLAVAGYSYGGFMTCYLTSRDGRFAAAVAGGIISDLTSMSGTSDLGHFLSAYELNGRPWHDRASYRGLSPLAQVGKVTTPTLILQGAADLRCPVGQAQLWHTALRERGVPTRLVLYPAGSHLFLFDGPPSHRLDFGRRVVDWLEQYAGLASGPARSRVDAARWRRRLALLAERHRVPGATLGILRIGAGYPDELVEAAFGVLNQDTGVATTTESVFQIGSITKVWTSTLVMQLVDEGLLALDAPIVDVLPELQLADPNVTKQVTMRHLLTHTSGIDGDIFIDTGRGDDCVEKYVSRLDEAAQCHPLGASWSYCNSGFSVAGRVIEKLTGGSWDQAVRERICVPLELAHTVTLPEEALLHRAAVGHVYDGAGQLSRAPVWGLPRSVGPAGVIGSTAADVLGFARLHLTGGLAPGGRRLLTEESTTAMADRHAELPDPYTLADSCGLGWFRYGWGGHRVIGHDGNTIGQAAFLRLVPDTGLAVVLLTNGGNSRDLYDDLFREIFAELAGIAVPTPLAAPAAPPAVDLRRHIGRYERAGIRLDVVDRDGGAVLRVTQTGPLCAPAAPPVQELAMVPVDAGGDLFVVRQPPSRTWLPVTFSALPSGRQYLHFGARATPKVG